MGAIPFIAAIIFIGWRSVDHMEKHAKTDAWAKNLTINDHLNQITEKNIFVKLGRKKQKSTLPSIMKR